MTSKLHIQSSPSKDDDSYAEDDFEQIDSVGASNKLSPMKKNSKSFEFQTSKEAHLQTNQGLNHNQGKLGGDDDEMSGDLEKYIMEMKINPGPIQVDDNDHEEHAIDVNKVTQSLEGIKPLTENAEHQQLGEKLGYHERPLTHILTQDNTHNTHNTNFDSNHNHTQKHKSPHPKLITHQSPLASKGHKEEEEHEDQVNEAQKVESLLMELFPDKYGKKKSKGKKSGGKHSQQLNSLMGNKLGLFAEEEEDIADQAKDVLSTLEGQLKLLKRELKVKDEKIVKLTEHSMMMANHMDRLKGEIAKLHARLRDAEVEIEVKETRIAELLKSKKKIKKVSQKSSPIAAHDKSLAGIESENIKLREREQALMEAVEELSSQNEDLIVKLRESMQRELELSSKRAALVSHSVMNHNNSSSLPNIHEKDQAYHHQSYGEQRTQSEPSSSDAPLKRGKKVKGRSHY